MKGRTLALAGVAAAGLIVARRLSTPQRMPYAGIFQRALAEKRGEAEAERLVARAQTRYDELYAQRSRLDNRALRFHLERGILPGLALYQTLLEESDDRQAVLAEMEHVLTSVSAGLSRLLSLVGRFPDPFAVFRRVEPWVVRLGFPAEGWEVEPVEDSETCVAFNVRRCFYVDTLSTYGAPELTAVFCGGDDVVFPMMAPSISRKRTPSISWGRTMTLGRGHDRCDFRWCRVEPERTLSGARAR